MAVDGPFDSSRVARKIPEMAPSHPRETLVCIGGPLHAKRLSVPAGLRWFSFGDDSLAAETLGDPETGVVAIETIESVDRYGWATDETEPIEPPAPPVYVRRQFVTGESGLIHVFAFRKA